jgi:recombination protein RecR
MSSDRIASLDRLKAEFQKLPGIGPRSAERLAFHVLRSSREEAAGLSQAIVDVKDLIVHCQTCYNLTEEDPCAICRDPRREQGEIWVVEQPKDLMSLEASGLVRGVYHVLMGHIAPLEGVGPDDLTINDLIARVKTGEVRELVLATNPTMEGDGTALHIHSLLSGFDVRVTRPARGLSVGSPLEYATAAMIESAIRGRTVMD